MKKITKVLSVLLCLVSLRSQAQFMEYESIPIIPPPQYIIPNTPNIQSQVDANKKRRLEMEVLQEQRDLLRRLNGNSAKADVSNIISLKLLGAATADLKLNFKTDWVEFEKNCTLQVNKVTGKAILNIPDLNNYSTYTVNDIQTHTGEGYSVNTLQFESGEFVSVLNIYKEKGLWILWGGEDKSELVVFQSLK